MKLPCFDWQGRQNRVSRKNANHERALTVHNVQDVRDDVGKAVRAHIALKSLAALWLTYKLVGLGRSQNPTREVGLIGGALL